MSKKKKHKHHDPRDAVAPEQVPSTAVWAQVAGAHHAEDPGHFADAQAASSGAVAGSVICRPDQRLCKLREIDPDATGPYRDKDEAADDLKHQRKRISELQERLYAEHRQSLLVVLQAIDTGGKDGTIRHVFEGVNPQGCQVWSFKVPTSEEADHDFLWRYHAKTPGRGMINIFNRSHYEDVLVVRVKNLVPEEVWRKRYALINDFERLLTQSGTTVVKFFLHISKDEQKRRLQSRIDDPSKNWKFASADLKERGYWDEYTEAFEAAINECSTELAPWHVVPANHKWFRNLVVARTIADTLEAMSPAYPKAEKGLKKSTIPD